MENIIENTPKESIFYEDNKVIVALAHEPITKGHSVVIWKNREVDINNLSTEDYEYLMDVVDVTRESLCKYYSTDKVYLMYLDECKWVHWHLVPRYNEKGFNILKNQPIKTDDFSDVEKLKEIFISLNKKMIIER
jgi:diadenosine tetraphosphate (Ap4A) HIT family hydrolase